VTTRSYRDGGWFGIFGDHATVLLPPSEKGRVAQLWELVDDGAGFDEVLDALISSGLRELPGFVLVSELDTDTKVVVRGAARASFTADSGPLELEGSTATTWVERSLTGVTRMVIEVGDDDIAGDDLPITNGLVRVGRVDAPPYAPEPEPEPEPEVVAEPEPDQPDDAEHLEDVEDTAATPLGEGHPQPEPVPGPFAPPIPEAPAPPTTDHDGLTRAGSHDPDQFSPPQPGIPGQPPAPSITRPVARLVFSSGQTVEVDRATLVGRAPEARRFPSTEQPRLVTVPSPHHEISSTHLEVRPGSGADHGSAVVVDLGSTNGTVLVQPGLPPEDLQAGIAVQLIPGAIIDLGDGVTIQVMNP
jgi:hypothetical protein